MATSQIKANGSQRIEIITINSINIREFTNCFISAVNMSSNLIQIKESLTKQTWENYLQSAQIITNLPNQKPFDFLEIQIHSNGRKSYKYQSGDGIQFILFD